MINRRRFHKTTLTGGGSHENSRAMKNLLVCLFLFPLMVHAQTTKTEDLLTGGNCKVSCMETFNNNDSLISAYASLDAKDDRLPTLKNYFTIFYDTPQNVYKFLTEIEKFNTDKSGTATEISMHKFEIDKTSGAKEIKIYDERGIAFHRFSTTMISSIKTKLREWAVKHKVKLE